MLLNVFKDLSNWFFNVKDSISLDKSLLPFIAGIGLGFILSILLYILFVFVSFKKNQKKVQINDIEIDNEKIRRIISNSKNKFSLEASMKPISQKFSELCEISWEMIQDIASVYYPDSKFPVYELSAEEILLLNHYITNRVDNLLSGRLLKKIKTYRLSNVFNLLEAKRKYEENKIVKAAKKANATGIAKTLGVIAHTVNPFHWIKRVTIEIPFIKISNKIALVIIDIVSEETIKIYSKNVFKEEDDLEFISSVKEDEKFLENAIVEEEL